MLTKTATRIAEEYGYDFVLQQDLFMKKLLTKLVKNKEKIDRTNLANARKQFKERSHTWYCTNCLYVYKSRYSIHDHTMHEMVFLTCKNMPSTLLCSSSRAKEALCDRKQNVQICLW